MANTQILTIAKFEELKKSPNIILIDFSATWCPPCKVMTPIFRALSEDPELSEIGFYECDVDEETEVAALFSVSSIPTFPLVVFKGDGSFDLKTDVITKVVGAQDGISFRKVYVDALAKIKSE